MTVRLLALFFLLTSFTAPVHAATGAAFLKIPVGAGPAAMGNAYSALANDAYAAPINPAGLGFVSDLQISAQHLAYLESIRYEYAGVALPLRSRRAQTPRHGIGASVQYLASGDIRQTGPAGESLGDFSVGYGAYSLAYGRAVTSRLALGVSGKWIHGSLADVSADAFAADIGSMFRISEAWTAAATVANIGTSLTFIESDDALPLQARFGLAYQPAGSWRGSVEGIVRKDGPKSAHVGAEWRPLSMLSLRAGYRTDTLKELGAIAGVSAGLGVHLWDHELGYAWVPLGDLGDTHYISLSLRFSSQGADRRNLIRYERRDRSRQVRRDRHDIPVTLDLEQMQMMQLLDEDKSRLGRSD